MYNQSGPADSRKVLSGKDAVLFNGEGVMLATIESFQVQVNVSNSDYQPLGDAQAHRYDWLQGDADLLPDHH